MAMRCRSRVVDLRAVETKLNSTSVQHFRKRGAQNYMTQLRNDQAGALPIMIREAVLSNVRL